MLGVFARKLNARVPLSHEETEAVLSLPTQLERFKSHQIICVEEEVVSRVGVLTSGFAHCFKIVGRKSRQVTGLLIEGDAINLASILTHKPCYHVQANADTDIHWVSHKDLRALCAKYPNLSAALWLDTLVEASIAREWIANIGQRRASERILHLMLELSCRQEWLKPEGNTFSLPLNQAELASALGLSLVHTNKSLRKLVAQGLIRFRDFRVEIFDQATARKIVDFDPAYLCLDQTSGGV